MDLRTPRPVERREVGKPEATPVPVPVPVSPAPTAPQQPPQESRPKKETPIAVQRTGAPRHAAKDEKSKKRLTLPVGIAIILLLILLGWFALWRMQGNVAGIDNSKYQAVIFTDGQAYFGKLKSVNGDYLKLTDIFYLQTKDNQGTSDTKNPQEASSDKSDVQLIKLGNEIHGPEDEMIISRDQVMYYENLKKDSKVAQKIEEYKKQ